MYCGLSVKREDRERICFAFPLVFVCRQKPEDSQTEPRADDAITRGGIGDLVSLVYICACTMHVLVMM